MSPDIYVEGRLIASVPDKTGLHEALDGSPLYVDVDRLDADQKRQLLIVEGPVVDGRRTIGLTLEGKGSTNKLKKGGDGEEPVIDAVLHDRPIRVTYSPKIKGSERLIGTLAGIIVGYDRGAPRTLCNPKWVRGHGRR